MTFLRPEFLFGLFAIAVPIIVHLFKFRKAKKIYFSNTRFIQEVKKSTSSKRRLKHLLILASRILFIAFLVFAFAQPVIPSKQGMASVDQVFFYVDNSLSMTNNMENGMTGLDDALATVEKLIDIYPANTDFKLLTNDFSPSSNGLKSKDEVKELMTEVRRSYISRSFEDIYGRLTSEMQSNSGGKLELFFISDFQKSTFGSSIPDIDSVGQLFFIPKVFPSYQNVFIDTVYLENPYLMGNQTNKLHVRLSNNGVESVDEMPLKLLVNDIQVSSSTVNIEPNDQEIIAIDLSMPLEKINRVRIEFEEFPVTFDNDFLLVLNKSDRIKITEIKRAQEASPIEFVYGNTELFNFHSQHTSNIDYSLITQADILIVNQLDEIEEPLMETITNYMEANGTVLIIPHENTDITALQNLTGIDIRKSMLSELQELQPPDLSNPFFADIFEETDDNLQMPVAMPVINWQGERKHVFSFKNNEKFLSEIKPGTYLLASPLDEAFGNFARHALFVPTMYKLASISKDIGNHLYYSASDNTISLKLDSINRQAVYKLSSSENEIIPGQNISGNQLNMQMPKYTLQKSFYDLMVNENYLTTIALNTDKSESLLAAFTQEELEDLFDGRNNISVFDAPDSKKAENEIRKLKFGTPLWKYALILSLLFLLSEVLLIRFFK